MNRSKRVSRLRRGAKIDACAHAIAQLEVPGNEIGMQMRQEYVLDLETVLSRESDVLFGVALRVDDGRCTRLLVSNNVGSMRQTRQIELFEDHSSTYISAARRVNSKPVPGGRYLRTAI